MDIIETIGWITAIFLGGSFILSGLYVSVIGMVGYFFSDKSWSSALTSGLIIMIGIASITVGYSLWVVVRCV